jgi:hypothetical protein
MKTYTLLISAVAVLSLVAQPALGQEPASSKKGSKPKREPMFTMPSLGELPKGDGLVAPKAERLDTGPSIRSGSATYEVVSVMHAKAFQRSGGTTTPVLPLEELSVTGNPPTSEKFTTVVRIKSPEKVSAPIDVVILDARGDTAMTATGQVSFQANGGEQSEYTVDWDPTPMRAGGNFTVLIRVAGQPLGTYPLKVAVKQ